MRYVCVFITAVPITKLFAGAGGGLVRGGHVLRETTSRGQCELVCPSRTGTREEPGTFTQGGALFSLVPLVWETNPTTSPSGDVIPTIRGSGAHPGGACVCFITAGPITKLFACVCKVILCKNISPVPTNIGFVSV